MDLDNEAGAVNNPPPEPVHNQLVTSPAEANNDSDPENRSLSPVNSHSATSLVAPIAGSGEPTGLDVAVAIWAKRSEDELRACWEIGWCLYKLFGEFSLTPQGKLLLNRLSQRLGVPQGDLILMRDFADKCRNVDQMRKKFPEIRSFETLKANFIGCYPVPGCQVKISTLLQTLQKKLGSAKSMEELDNCSDQKKKEIRNAALQFLEAVSANLPCPENTTLGVANQLNKPGTESAEDGISDEDLIETIRSQTERKHRKTLRGARFW